MNGNPAGDSFPLIAGEGHVVELKASAPVTLRGLAVPVAVAVSSGLNLVGFHRTTEGYGAYELLESLAGSGMSASLSRFNPLSGRFQTAVREDGRLSGHDFDVQPGEGYLFFASEPLSELSVPRRLFLDRAVGI